MDMSTLWNDDPEELLLDLGFGCDEPDLSGRIPARFINYQSHARGINLQVFLDAQKTRIDVENPDVSNRFRQVEVLQQVSTAFSSLMGSSSDNIPAEARERKRRIVALFRQASKRAKRQTSDRDSGPGVELQVTPEESELIMNPADTNLSPVIEEEELPPQTEHQALVQCRSTKPESLWDGRQTSGNVSLHRGKRLTQESFEIEEIQSFDEGVLLVGAAAADHIMRRMMRTSSCQSDSSGFLEEPFIPTLSQVQAPGADLIKALSGLSGGSTDSQKSDAPCSPPQDSSPPALPCTFPSSVPEELFHPAESPSTIHSQLLVFSCHSKSDFSMSELDSTPAAWSLQTFPSPSLFTSIENEKSSLKKDLSSPLTSLKKPDCSFGAKPPPEDDGLSYKPSPTTQASLGGRDEEENDSQMENTDHKIDHSESILQRKNFTQDCTVLKIEDFLDGVDVDKNDPPVQSSDRKIPLLDGRKKLENSTSACTKVSQEHADAEILPNTSSPTVEALLEEEENDSIIKYSKHKISISDRPNQSVDFTSEQKNVTKGHANADSSSTASPPTAEAFLEGQDVDENDSTCLGFGLKIHPTDCQNKLKEIKFAQNVENLSLLSPATAEAFLDKDKHYFQAKKTDPKNTLLDGYRKFENSMSVGRNFTHEPLGSDESFEEPLLHPNQPSQVSQPAEVVDSKRATDSTNHYDTLHTHANHEDDVFYPTTERTTPQSEGVNECFDCIKEESLQNAKTKHSSGTCPVETDVSTLSPGHPVDLCAEEIPTNLSTQVPDQNPDRYSEHAGKNNEQDASGVIIEHIPSVGALHGGPELNAEADKDKYVKDDNSAIYQKEEVLVDNLNTSGNITDLEWTAVTDLDKSNYAVLNEKNHRSIQLRHPDIKVESEIKHIAIAPIEEDDLVEEDFSLAKIYSFPDDSLKINKAEEEESHALSMPATSEESPNKYDKTKSPTTHQDHNDSFEGPDPPTSSLQPGRSPLVGHTEQTLPPIHDDESPCIDEDHIILAAKTDDKSTEELISKSQRTEKNGGKHLQDLNLIAEKETHVEHFENLSNIVDSQEDTSNYEHYEDFKRVEPEKLSATESPPAAESGLDQKQVFISPYDKSIAEEKYMIQDDLNESTDPILGVSFHRCQKSEERKNEDIEQQGLDFNNERKSETVNSLEKANETSFDKTNQESFIIDCSDDIDEPAQLTDDTTEGQSKSTRISPFNKYDHMEYLVQEDFHATIDHSFMDDSDQGRHTAASTDEVKDNVQEFNLSEEVDYLGDQEHGGVGGLEPSSPQQLPEMIWKNLEDPSSTAHHSLSGCECPNTKDGHSEYPEVRKHCDAMDQSQTSEAESKSQQDQMEDKSSDSPVKLISEEIYYETAHSIDESDLECVKGEHGSSGPGGMVSALIEIETLDQVFETSVDGSEGEYGDPDVYFQQLDTERRVYWAEPIMVSDFNSSSGPSDSEDNLDDELNSSPTPEPTEDTTFMTTQDASIDPSSSILIPPSPHFSSIDPKPGPNHIQVPTSSSSHIVHRKDVPFVTESKPRLPPLTLPLDTSTPFHAVQSWTDLRIQQTLPNRHLHSTPNMFPLKNSRSNYQAASRSVDRLCLEEDGGEDETKLWEPRCAVLPPEYCIPGDHQCARCVRKGNIGPDIPGVISYSLEELEEMILCLQQFRSVLTNMEEQLTHDQASVYKGLTEQDRRTVSEVEGLRRAVKQEALDLETQLHNLVHDYDDTLKMKLHRLLHEQSQLCSQLRVTPQRHRFTSGHNKVLDAQFDLPAQNLPE